MSHSSNPIKCLAVTFYRHLQPLRFALNVFDLFISFKHINITNQKNPLLSQAVQNCYLLGHVEPYLLLIGGSSLHLQTIKSSWNRGQLKSPFGFSISSVSDMGTWLLENSQFNAMRLEEVICQLIWQVTQSEPSCSLERLIKYLDDVYNDVRLPKPSLREVNSSLSALTRAGAIYFSGRGYNLLTPEKLAVAKWLESVPETCSVADSILDYSNTRKAPIAETELFGSNVSSSDRVNSPDNNQGKDQLCASKHKFGGNEHYRNTSALMPVPENAEQDHVLKSHTLHSMSSDQYQNGPMRPCNPITPVSLSSVRLKSSDSQFPISYETNRINGRCASGLITSSKEKHNVANVVSVDGFSQLHRAQPGPTVFHTVDQSETGVIRFSKHAKLPSTKKFQPPGLFKWLLSRLHHIRLSWRRSHHSCFDDKIIDPQKRVISTRILNSKNEYYTHYPFENGVFEDYQMCRQSVSPNNLRRCFSLSDGGKTNKVDNQTVKNCCSGVDSSFFPSISKTESNISDHRKQSSYSYKDLHWISQKNLIESPSFISLTVSPLPISKNRFLNENRTGVKSAPRLLTSSPVLVRNFSKNDSKISVQDSSKTSTKRDSGFAEETHGPYVFGNVTQSCLLISPDDPHTYHNFKPSSSRKASPNSSNLWWYTGSNLLTPFGELPTRHFTTSYVKVSCD